jgi:hypothetical protein
MVAHACNPNYSRGGDQGDYNLRPVLGKNLRPYGWVRCHPHVTDEKTEAQNGHTTSSSHVTDKWQSRYGGLSSVGSQATVSKCPHQWEYEGMGDMGAGDDPHLQIQGLTHPCYYLFGSLL